jgi:hypothetical protein
MDDIIISYRGVLYKIEKEPFETHEDAYSRGWFIVKNQDKYDNYKQLVSLSMIHNNKKKMMQYVI